MITPEIVVAYTECKLKAYLLLCTKQKGISHKYISILEEKAQKHRVEYFHKVKMEIPESELYSYDGMRKGVPILFEANWSFDDLTAYADAIIRVEKISSKMSYDSLESVNLPSIIADSIFVVKLLIISCACD